MAAQRRSARNSTGKGEISPSLKDDFCLRRMKHCPKSDFNAEGSAQENTLDIFGIDFDVMPDGRILFFEANATMLLLGYEGAEYQDVMHPADADARLEAAIGDI